MDTYKDLIEKEKDEHNPQFFYFRLKRYESESSVQSPQPSQRTVDADMVLCSICKEFVRSALLQIHIAGHRLVTCKRCGQSVPSDQLSTHESTHYTIIKCNICNIFLRSDDLQDHMRSPDHERRTHETMGPCDEVQAQQPIGVADPPGITIRDRLVQSGQYAELIGELSVVSVEEKISARRSIAEADISGYWIIPGGRRKTFHDKTDGRGEFATTILIVTPGQYTLVITAIKKAGYTSPAMSIKRQWDGFPSSMDQPHENDSFPKGFRQESELHRRFDYSAAITVSVAERHQALQHAVENPDGLGLAYVVRWLTNYNRYNEANPKQRDAVGRREDDLRWLKTTYYDKLQVKHFRFPPI